jgi:hypothetical protein
VEYRQPQDESGIGDSGIDASGFSGGFRRLIEVLCYKKEARVTRSALLLHLQQLMEVWKLGSVTVAE